MASQIISQTYSLSLHTIDYHYTRSSIRYTPNYSSFSSLQPLLNLLASLASNSHSQLVFNNQYLTNIRLNSIQFLYLCTAEQLLQIKFTLFIRNLLKNPNIMISHCIGSNPQTFKTFPTISVELNDSSCVLNYFSQLNQSLTKQILQTRQIQSSRFIQAIKEHPLSHQLLKFSSNQHWSPLKESLQQIHLKHVSLSKTSSTDLQSQTLQKSLSTALSSLEHKIQKNLLQITIKIEQIVGWTWIPRLKMDHIRLHDKQQRYFIDGFQLMKSLTQIGQDSSRIFPFSVQGNSLSYTNVQKQERQRIHQEKCQAICFTLSQKEFNKLFEKCVKKVFENILILFGQYCQGQNIHRQLMQLRQELDRKTLQNDILSGQSYKNQMALPSFPIENRAAELCSGPKCQKRSKQKDIALGYAFLIEQFMGWILSDYVDHHHSSEHDTQDKNTQTNTNKAPRLNIQTDQLTICAMVRFMVLISMKQILRQKQFNDIQINKSTLKIVTRIMIKKVKNIIEQIKLNLSKQIEQLKSEINDCFDSEKQEINELINGNNQKRYLKQNGLSEQSRKSNMIKQIVRQLMYKQREQINEEKQHQIQEQDFDNIKMEDSHYEELSNQLSKQHNSQQSIIPNQFQCLQQSIKQDNTVKRIHKKAQQTNQKLFKPNKLPIRQNNSTKQNNKQKIKQSIKKLITSIHQSMQSIVNENSGQPLKVTGLKHNENHNKIHQSMQPTFNDNITQPLKVIDLKLNENNSKNTKSSRKYITNDHLNLVDDILLFNYVKLSSQIHQIILNFTDFKFSFENPNNIKPNRTYQQIAQDPFINYQNTNDKLQKIENENQYLKDSGQIKQIQVKASQQLQAHKIQQQQSQDQFEGSFEDLSGQFQSSSRQFSTQKKDEEPRVIRTFEQNIEQDEQQIHSIDSSFSHLSQSSFSDLNDSARDIQPSQRIQNHENPEFSYPKPQNPDTIQQQVSPTAFQYSQLNKAFLLSKTHISFDTIDLSQERQLKITELNIDPKMIHLNECSDQVQDDWKILKFMEMQEDREALKREFIEVQKKCNQQSKLQSQVLQEKPFTLETLYKSSNPLSEQQSTTIHLHVKYTIHFSQYIQQILAQFSQSKHKSLQKAYNIIRFIEINLITHLRNQLILNIDQQVSQRFTQKEYQWEYLHKRNGNIKWQECQNKIARTKDIAFGKIRTYMDNIPKLKMSENYENQNPNVAKADRLMQKYPELMNIVLMMNSQEFDSRKFDGKLVQRIYYWITKLIKEEYLNELFFERAFKRISAKSQLPAIPIKQILNPLILKQLLQKNPNVRTALNQLMIFTIEHTKIWNIICTIPYYTYQTQKQNIKRKNKKNIIKSPINIDQILKNLDLFYIYKFQRMNTSYLEEKKNQNQQEFYKAVEIFLSMSQITCHFFQSKLLKQQLLMARKQQNSQNHQSSKRSRHIHDDRVGILDDSFTSAMVNPLIESAYTCASTAKQKERFTLNNQLLQSMKNAVTIAKTIKP